MAASGWLWKDQGGEIEPCRAKSGAPGEIRTPDPRFEVWCSFQLSYAHVGRRPTQAGPGAANAPFGLIGEPAPGFDPCQLFGRDCAHHATVRARLECTGVPWNGW